MSAHSKAGSSCAPGVLQAHHHCILDQRSATHSGLSAASGTPSAPDSALEPDEALALSTQVASCGSGQATQQACPACCHKAPRACDALVALLQACSSSNAAAGGAPMAAAARHVLPVAGCEQCGQHADRACQAAIASAGGVEALLAELTAASAQQQQQQPKQQPVLLQALQALLFTCCGHAGNLHRLLEAGGLDTLAQLCGGQLLAMGGGQQELQLCCVLLGEAAAAVAPGTRAPQLQQCITRLARAAQDLHLLAATGEPSARSSCCAAVWALGKAAAAALGSSSSECVEGALRGTILPLMDAAGSSQQQQQQQCRVLVLLCLAWCSQVVAAPHSSASVHAAVAAGVSELLSRSNSGSSPQQQLVQARGQSLLALCHAASGSSCSSEEQDLLRLGGCQLLSLLRQSSGTQQHGAAAGKLLGPIGPLPGPVRVPAGATATIEVVYAGSPAPDKAARDGDKVAAEREVGPTPAATRARLSTCSSAASSTDSRAALEAAACAHTQKQQLEQACAASDQQHPLTQQVLWQLQQPACKGDAAAAITAAAAAAAKQPPESPDSRRAHGGLGTCASTSSSSISSMAPNRSEMCSSASCNSIQASGEGQSGSGNTGAGSSEAGRGSGAGHSSGAGSSHGMGAGSGQGSSSNLQGSGGAGGGGGSSSGRDGGSGDGEGDGDKRHPPDGTSPSSTGDDGSASAAAGLSTSSDSVVLSPMAAMSSGLALSTAAAAAAPVSLGLSASDPVIVPRPPAAAAGALPGLMLRAAPDGPLGQGLGAPGTSPAVPTPQQAAAAAAGGCSQSHSFSFPTSLPPLNTAGLGARRGGTYGTGGLADVLLSPSAFGARGLLGQQGSVPLRGSAGGLPSSGAAVRRASDAGTMGSSLGLQGGWGSSYGLAAQQHSGLAAGSHAGALPVGSWPNAGLGGLSALEEHMQQQQRAQQQQLVRGAHAAPDSSTHDQRALSGFLQMPHPGLMGLIGGADTAGSLGQAGGTSHLLSWLTEPAGGLQSTGSAPAAGHSASADASRDAGPARQRDQSSTPGLPAPAAAHGSKPDLASSSKAAVLPSAGPAAAGAAAGDAAASSTAPMLASAGSGSISSSGSFSAFGSIAHSASGESLEDLEALRMGSASFAAALAEAEAIAAGVAASMAAVRQQAAGKGAAGTVAATGRPAGAADIAPAGDDSASNADADADADAGGDGPAYDPAELTKGAPSRHLWLGNLHQRLPRSLLRSVFEKFGPVEDVVTFPGRMYAFVNFREAADAAKAARAVQEKEVPALTGNRRLVVKFRPSRRALGKVAEAMVPGLVDPASASSSDRGNGSAPSSHAGSCNNLAAASGAAAGGPPVHSRNSSASSLAWMSAGAAASSGISALQRVGSSNAAADDTASIRSGVSSIAGGTARELRRAESAQSNSSMPAAPELPPSLSAEFAAAAGSSSSSSGAAADSSLSSTAAAAAAVAAVAAAAVASGGSDSNAAAAAQMAAAAAALAAVDAGLPQGPGSVCDFGMGDVEIPEGRPSRHLWLGNIPLKPNRGAMEALFLRFGPLESVRVFPGKTFAFVNYVHAGHAIAAKAALDGQPSPVITGPKPMVIRFQKDHAGAPPGTAATKALEVAAARARKAGAPRTSLTGISSLLGVTTADSLGSLGGVVGEDEVAGEPAVNLSNKLNPNNIHYDRELAARYKRMSKAEKEALWAQDRAMQQLEANPAAASLLSAAAVAAASGQHPGAAAAVAAAAAAAVPHLYEGGLQTNPAAAAAAAASSLYHQLLSNPRLAAILAAQGNPAAAGLLQHAHSLSAAGAGAAWGAQSAYQQQQQQVAAAAAAAAALNARGLASSSAAAAAAAARGLGGLLGQMGGLDCGAPGSAEQYLASSGLSSQMLNQALLQQQLAGSGFAGATPQEQATLAALSGIDPHSLMAAGPARLSLEAHLNAMGSGHHQHHQHQHQHHHHHAQQAHPGGGAPSTPLGGPFMSHHHAPPGSPAPSNVSRFSASGASFGGQPSFGGRHGPSSSLSGGGMMGGDGGPGSYHSARHSLDYRRVSNSGSSLMGAASCPGGGLGPIGPSGGGGGGGGGRHSLSLPRGGFGELGQQQSGLLSPTWSGLSSAMAGDASGGTAAAAQQQQHLWPQQFLCPLTQQLMTDPVIAADGLTYQADAIREHMRLRDASPVTGQPLSSAALQPNFALRAAISAEVAKMQQQQQQQQQQAMSLW